MVEELDKLQSATDELQAQNEQNEDAHSRQKKLVTSDGRSKQTNAEQHKFIRGGERGKIVLCNM